MPKTTKRRVCHLAARLASGLILLLFCFIPALFVQNL